MVGANAALKEYPDQATIVTVAVIDGQAGHVVAAIVRVGEE